MSRSTSTRHPAPADAEPTFDAWLTLVRRRWWARRTLEAATVATGLAVFAIGVAVAYMATERFDEAAVDAARIAIYVLLPLILLATALALLLRRLSRLQAAHYIEARSAGLDALVVSAAEVNEQMRASGGRTGSGSLERTLLERAAAACAGTGNVRALELARLRVAATAFTAIAFVAIVGSLWGPAPIRHGLVLLASPSADAAPGNPYRLTVRPGDVVVAAGADQAIAAQADGFRPERVELMTRTAGKDRWTPTAMTPSETTAGHEALLIDIDAPVDYYVRSGPIESSRHRLAVVPRPGVERIDLRYEYPEHTGRPPKRVRDGGPISSVRGSRVEVRVVPDTTAETGALVLDGERRIPLKRSGDSLRATLALEADGRYRIELPAGQAGPVAASAEYPIRVHADALPAVALEWPGRDTRVTSIEEIGISASARDDVAVRALELVLNINGSDDRVITFEPAPDTPTAIEATHVLALETLPLEPGDLIAYYARARDAPGDPDRVAVTDLFFMEVRPFERRYHRASGGGGGGAGGGQGPRGAELSAQQRSLVVALFKLKRERDRLDPLVVTDRIDTLAVAQARIRERVDAIVRRFGPRRFVRDNEGYRRMAEEMPRAARAMVDVEAKLAGGDVAIALPRAREALRHLQRADAAFRDVMISQSRGTGGQNDGARRELTELFRLEMDKFRNQYESLQRGQWNRPEQAIEDALDKLRELARRQQREIERTRLRGQQGSGGTTTQQALAAELEKLERELARLTRHRDPAVTRQAENARDQLRAARAAMERSARRGDAEAGEEALERLRSVQRTLERAGRQGLVEGVTRARERAEVAAAEQRDIRQALDRQRSDGDQRSASPRELARRKHTLAGELGELTNQVGRLLRQARQAQPELAGDLEAAERMLRDRGLEARMRVSAEALDRDPERTQAAREAQLEDDIEFVRQRLVRADTTARGDGQAGLSEAERLERLRALVRGLKADEQRLADAERQGAASSSGEQSTGTPPASGAEGAATAGTGTGTTSSSTGTGPVGSAGGYDSSYRLGEFTARMRQRLGELGELADSFQGAGDVARDISALVEALQGETVPADLQALQRQHTALLARLQDIEYRLRENAGGHARAVAVRESTDVPPRYQAAVNRYYRSLSEEPGGE
ncbi:DUF4175 family protein [Arhodomonas sp. AD133]|uniref:DUF4175 family protein n=1 Tax=Arhodomonas sp. AD133 TaxID=3415009 RepID=UPI003EB707F5